MYNHTPFLSTSKYDEYVKEFNFLYIPYFIHTVAEIKSKFSNTYPTEVRNNSTNVQKAKSTDNYIMRINSFRKPK